MKKVAAVAVIAAIVTILYSPSENTRDYDGSWYLTDATINGQYIGSRVTDQSERLIFRKLDLLEINHANFVMRVSGQQEIRGRIKVGDGDTVTLQSETLPALNANYYLKSKSSTVKEGYCVTRKDWLKLISRDKKIIIMAERTAVTNTRPVQATRIPRGVP
jgi:hypothetical protein